MATTNYNIADITRLPDNATRYQQDSEIIDTVNANNIIVDNALQGLESNKQSKSDNTLNTTAKTVVGAINEHETDISTLSTNLEQKAPVDSPVFTGTPKVGTKTIATTDKINISSTLANGWVISHTGEVGLEISNSGKIVNIVGGIKDGAVAVATTIATIPVGYRPTKEIYVPISKVDGGIVMLQILTDGTIRVANNGIAWTAGKYYFNVTYSIN